MLVGGALKFALVTGIFAPAKLNQKVITSLTSPLVNSRPAYQVLNIKGLKHNFTG
jgi:hypothetical protein